MVTPSGNGSSGAPCKSIRECNRIIIRFGTPRRVVRGVKNQAGASALMHNNRDMRQPMTLRRCFSAMAIIGIGVFVAGCASSGGSQGGLLDQALAVVGLARPVVPEVPAQVNVPTPKKVSLRLHAGDVLNTDASGRSLAVVTRIYKLRDSTAFLQAPYDSFQPDAVAKELPFAQDVVESREVVLTPGVRHEVVETIPLDAKFVAVVAMFRSPASARWRFVFETNAAAATGITLGVHGCALSVAQGEPVSATAESLRLAGVRCQ
jgi:type VI secretion system protein VasD